MKKQKIATNIVEVLLYLVLFPIMLNSVINYLTEVNIPTYLMSLLVGVLIYSPEIKEAVRKQQLKHRRNKLLSLKREALREEPLTKLINLATEKIETTPLTLEDYDEAFTAISHIDVEDSNPYIKEELINFILKGRK